MSIDVRLYPKQAKAFSDPSQFKLLRCGRQVGKSTLIKVLAVTDCLSFNRPLSVLQPEVVLITCPLLKQARSVYLEPLSRLIESLGGQVNKSSMVLSLPGKPSIVLGGSDQADGLRGLSVWRLFIDEAQDTDYELIQKALLPMTAAIADSKVIFAGTPNGIGGTLWRVENMTGMSVHHIQTKDNPYVTPGHYRTLADSMTQAAISQELLGEYVQGDQAVFPRVSLPSWTIPDLKILRNYLTLKEGYDPEVLKWHRSPINICIDWGSRNWAFMAVRTVLKSQRLWFHIEYLYENSRDGKSQSTTMNGLRDRVFQTVAELSAKYPNAPIVLSSDPSCSPELVELVERVDEEIKTCSYYDADNKILKGLSTLDVLLENGRISAEPQYVDRVKQVLEEYVWSLKPDGSIDYTKPLDGQRDEIVDILRYVTVKPKNNYSGKRPDKSSMSREEWHSPDNPYKTA